MSVHLTKVIRLFFLCSIPFALHSQTTNVYTTSTTWTVPATVTSISIKVYGGGGGTGGQDCGAGCTNAAAGPAGYVVASFAVTPGNVVGIYPGAKGTNGTNNATGTGGGAGGIATYSTAYNGGTGGNAGSSGASGGGGGGGAASLITISSVIRIVAGGAGGGGGMANLAGSGLPGTSTTSANGTSNTGGNGTTPGGDGGGGGGGGGGQFGSIGGNVHAAGGESAGDGGFLGANSISGASAITTNGNIAWTNGGQIEITFTSTLAVTWLGFTAQLQGNGVVLHWGTATEQDTRDYMVQRSSNGTDWIDIGNVAAAGNSSSDRYYQYTDQKPLNGLNYYRLLQADLNGKINYSAVLPFKFTGNTREPRLYPNPVVNGTTMLSLKTAATVKVYSSIGTRLMQKEFTAGDHLLNLASFPKGTYYMKINNDPILFVIQ